MYEPDPTMSAADPVVKARTTDVDVGKPAAAALCCQSKTKKLQ